MSDPLSSSRFYPARLFSIARSELWGLQPRLVAYNVATALMHGPGATDARVKLLTLLGSEVGSGTILRGAPRITGGAGLFERLSVGKESFVDCGCVFDLEERIQIGDRVTLGAAAMLLTSTHEMASAAHRAGPITRAPLHVGDGAWLGARCILLPGVTIGAGAIVDVGSVVTRDVAPNTRVAGTPAIVVEDLANPSSK